MVRVVAWVNSRIELDAVAPPGDHQPDGILAGCGCRSCAEAVQEAVRMRGLAEFASIGQWWRANNGAIKDLNPRVTTRDMMAVTTRNEAK